MYIDNRSPDFESHLSSLFSLDGIIRSRHIVEYQEQFTGQASNVRKDSQIQIPSA